MLPSEQQVLGFSLNFDTGSWIHASVMILEKKKVERTIQQQLVGWHDSLQAKEERLCLIRSRTLSDAE